MSGHVEFKGAYGSPRMVESFGRTVYQPAKKGGRLMQWFFLAYLGTLLQLL